MHTSATTRDIWKPAQSSVRFKMRPGSKHLTAELACPDHFPTHSTSQEPIYQFISHCKGRPGVALNYSVCFSSPQSRSSSALNSSQISTFRTTNAWWAANGPRVAVVWAPPCLKVDFCLRVLLPGPFATVHLPDGQPGCRSATLQPPPAALRRGRRLQSSPLPARL